MPDIDGLELVRHIHENRAHEFPPSSKIRAVVREVFPDSPDAVLPVDPGIPIVVVSAHTTPNDRECFLEQGIRHCIAKPIAMQQLNETLDEVHRQICAPRG